MIHAINQHGREAYFTDRVWDLMPKDKNGWIKFSEQGEVVIPQQIVEFQQNLKKEVAVVEEKNDVVIAETSKVHTKKRPLQKAKKPLKKVKK